VAFRVRATLSKERAHNCSSGAFTACLQHGRSWRSVAAVVGQCDWDTTEDQPELTEASPNFYFVADGIRG
jgi:hypothetical protein